MVKMVIDVLIVRGVPQARCRMAELGLTVTLPKADHQIPPSRMVGVVVRATPFVGKHPTERV